MQIKDFCHHFRLIVSLLFYNELEVTAHSGAKGIVKIRMDTMKLIGAEVKELGAIVRDPSGFDSKLVHKAAKELSQHASRIPELFPKASNQKPCKARKEFGLTGIGF